MSEQDDFTRVFLWVLGLLVLFTIVVMLVARAVGMDENSGSMADKDVDERTMPYGGVKVAEDPKAASEPVKETPSADSGSATAPAVEMPAESAAAMPVAEAPAIDGKALYAACMGCHDYGAAGAPKLGDKAAWAPRIAQGMDSMMTTAIQGRGGMPPKGGRLDYSDAQIKAIVEYMVSASQ